MSERLA